MVAQRGSILGEKFKKNLEQARGKLEGIWKKPEKSVKLGNKCKRNEKESWELF